MCSEHKLVRWRAPKAGELLTRQLMGETAKVIRLLAAGARTTQHYFRAGRRSVSVGAHKIAVALIILQNDASHSMWCVLL